MEATKRCDHCGKEFTTRHWRKKMCSPECSHAHHLEVCKAIITGDNIVAERKYGEPFQFKPYAKWVVAMNEAPVIPDKSYGFDRRIIGLNFTRRKEE